MYPKWDILIAVSRAVKVRSFHQDEKVIMFSALQDYIKRSLDREAITHLQIKYSRSLAKKRMAENPVPLVYLEVYASWKSVEESSIGRKTSQRSLRKWILRQQT